MNLGRAKIDLLIHEIIEQGADEEDMKYLAGRAEQLHMRDKLIKHLEFSRTVVESWPKWKRNILGVS